MRALLMAAGLGTRISDEINGIPKCTVNVGNITLIENMIRELKRHKITNIGMVVGYKADVLKDIFQRENISFFHNPFFDKTNSIASLWFARDFLQADEDYLLINADTFFEEQVLSEILLETDSPVMFADGARKEEGDYKFFYENGKLVNHGKHLSGDEITGEYIGVAKVYRDFLPQFKERLIQLINQQRHDLWWENVLYSFIGETDIFVKEISKGLFWGEVDTMDDYQRILAFTDQTAKI